MCIIDYKNKFIYIAIPKTATQSTENFILESLFDDSCVCNGCSCGYEADVLEPDAVHDLCISPHVGGIKQVFLKTPFGLSKNRIYKHSTALEIKNAIYNYESFKKVAVVRNPYDWYVSWYNYQKKWNENLSFSDWLCKFIGRGRIWEMQEILNWIVDENNNLIIDEIVEYSNLENGIISFFKKHKINMKNKIQFPRINISNCRNNLKYQKFYNKNTKNMVKNYQKKTIQYFNYNFFKI